MFIKFFWICKDKIANRASDSFFFICPYVGITFLVSIQASGFLQQKHPKCWDSITSITSSYVGITVSSLFLGIKIFQKKSRKYLVHIQASCKINYSLVTLLKKDSRKENYKHQFCRIRHKKLLSAKVVFLPTLTKYLQKSQILSALREEVAEQSEE